MFSVAEQADDRFGKNGDETGQGEQQADLGVGEVEISFEVRQCRAVQAVDEFVEQFNGVERDDQRRRQT